MGPNRKTIYKVLWDIGCHCECLPEIFDDFDKADAVAKNLYFDICRNNDVSPDDEFNDISCEVIEEEVVCCRVCGDVCQLPNGDLIACKSCGEEDEEDLFA